jgi:diadenosine tetraphosphate (Ap4A) HIT family hydrolase
LVSPKAVVPRFTDLSPAQVADLWTLAQRVGSVLERQYKVESLTLAIQDGPDAGQSVPHVHIHVLPRVKGDFEPNDKVYDALDGGDVKRNLDEDRVARTAEEMAAEAALYRPYFE